MSSTFAPTSVKVKTTEALTVSVASANTKAAIAASGTPLILCGCILSRHCLALAPIAEEAADSEHRGKERESAGDGSF